MSKEIDQKVVEMRFDNRHFEQNVQTTMSSIRKLEESCKFKGATKGFEDLDRSARNVDMTHLGKGLDMVQAKFSAMQVVAVTALANITNSAINAGKNLVKSLSIDQVTAGMSKYEQKTASVQTIMNATGKSIDEVNGYLEKLMWFSDETSYGFTDMTTALGQMTSSGGKIDNLIPLITGVANATAYAGKGAAEFSRIMYNLNQSYGAGYLQLMDWKSIELAGAGSKQLKQTFIDVAEQMGKIKKGQVTIANFSETLKDKWADTEVMEAAFGRFGEFSDAVHKMVESGEVETASEAIELLSGKYDEVSEKAFKSAQEAKSFTEAIDATKDAVSSGWMKTFELIFGNYEQAKVLWTELCSNLWDIFASGGESRNKLLQKALSYSPLSQFSEKLKKVTDTIQAPVKKLKEYEEVVNRIINGEFGNGQARWDKLTAAGYDWAHAQNLVNEKLGDSTRHSTKFTKELENQTKQTVELTDAKLKELGFTKDEIKMYRELEAESKKTGKSIDELIESMEEADGRTLLIGGFKNIGSSLIGVINAVKEAFSEIFPPMTALQLYNLIKKFNEFTENLRLTDKETGELNETGEKLKRTFQGIFAALDIVLTIVGGPIKFAFKILTKILGSFGMGLLDVTAYVGDAIVRFRDWLDATLDYNKVFKYLGSLIRPMIGRVKEWIEAFKGLPIVQESMSKLKDAFSGSFVSNAFIRTIEVLRTVIGAVIDGLKKCYDAFMSLPAVKSAIANVGSFISKIFSGIANSLSGINLDSFVNGISKFFDIISEWISGFNDYDEQGGNLISGLSGSLSDGIKAVTDAIIAICKAIYNTFTDFFDINSPSKVFFTLGKFCIAGLVAGLLFAKDDTRTAMGELGATLIEGAKTVIDTVIGVVKEIDLGTILAATGIFGFYKLATKTLEVVEMFGAGVKGFGSMCSGAGDVMKAVAAKINPKKGKFENIAESVLKLATSVAILAGAVYILAKLDTDELWNGVKAIAALAGIVIVLGVAAKLLNGADASFGKLALGLIGISIAMAILSKVMTNIVESIGTMSPAVLDQATDYIIGFGVFMVVLAGISKFGAGSGKGLLGMLLGVSAALLVMAKVTKILGTMEPAVINQARWYLLGFGAIIVVLMGIAKFGGGAVAGLGMLFLGISAALLAMAMCIKILGGIDESTLKQGIKAVGWFSVFVAGLIVIAKLCGGVTFAGMAGMFIGVSAVLLAMAACIKILGDMDESALKQGLKVVAWFSVFIAGLMIATKFSGNAGGLAAALLAMSTTLAVMAGLIVVLGLVPEKVIKKGLAVVGGISLIMSVLIGVSKLAEKSAGAIWGITAMLAVITTSILILSKVKTEAITSAAIAIGIVMGAVAVVLGVSKLAEKSMGSIIAMTVLIGIVAGFLYLIASLPAGSALPAAIALGLVLAALIGSMLLLNKVQKVSTNAIGALLVMTVALGILAGALWLIAGLPVASALAGAVALSVMMLALVASMILLQGVRQVSTNAIGALLVMTAALGILAGALWLIAGLPITNALVGAAALSVLMLALSASMMIISNVGAGAIAGAAALILIAGALAILTPCLQALGSMSLAQIGVGLLGLAGAFAVIGVAGLLLGPITPMILALSVGIAAIGVGCMAAGVGLMTFSLGLQTLAMMGPAGAAAITLLVTTILNLIPMIAVALANGIVQFATTIAAGAATLAAAIVTVVNAIISALVGTIPNLLAAAGVLLTSFLNFIVSYIPKMVDAGMKLIKGILQGIANNIGGIVKAAIDIVVNFIKGVSSKIGDVIDAGIKLMISFINGLANGIRNNQGQMISAINNLMDAVINAVKAYFSNFTSKGKDLIKKMIAGVKGELPSFKGAAKDMMDGFIKGVKEKFSSIKNAAVNAIKGAVDGVKSFLGIKSPSRVFMKIGRYTDEGFALGLKKYAKLGVVAAKNMGEGALEGLKDVLGVNSPATEGIDVGCFLTEGFAIGIEKLRERVKNAGEKVGSISVEGISEGIEKDMSAEEQAKKKATNIINAYKTTFDELDTEAKSWSLDFELGLVTESENLEQQLRIQSNRVANAWAEYQTTLDTLGADSNEAKTAFNKYKQELVDLKSAGSEFTTAQETELTNRKNALLEYNKFMNTHKADLLEMGVSEEEIEAAARKASGYDPDKTFDISTIRFSDAGASCVTAFGEKLQNGGNSGELVTATKTMVTTCTDTIKDQRPEWVDSGKYLVDGFVEGIRESIREAERAAAEMARASKEAAANVLDINSPSKEFVKFGRFVDMGFAQGITKYARVASDATNRLAESTIGSMVDSIANISNLANSDMDITPRIRPVIDASSMRGSIGQINGIFGQRTMELATVNAGMVRTDMDNLSSMVARLEALNDSGNTNIVKAISSLRGDFGSLVDAIGGMHIRMDSGTVVGELINKIDGQLGQIANHKGRGN